MLPFVAIVFVLVWGISLLASFTAGGYIHLLVLTAVVLLLVRIIREPAPARPFLPQGRRR